MIVTHGHTDHISGAPALAARYPAARFRKLPSVFGGSGLGSDLGSLAFADDLVSAIEIRAMWSRFGL